MKIKMHLAFILLATLGRLSAAQRYCQLESCPNRSHTLCQYPDSRAHERCGRPSSILYGMNNFYILNLLDLYNGNRPSIRFYELQEDPNIGPDDNNIVALDYTMQWDHELAEIAQTWANQCINHEDDCRNVDRFHVRQRTGVVTGPVDRPWPRINGLLRSWFVNDRLTSMNHINFNLFNEMEFLNFPASSHERWMRRMANRVGCGVLSAIRDGLRYVHVVCNYGPA